jgi:hypothetical protein
MSGTLAPVSERDSRWRIDWRIAAGRRAVAGGRRDACRGEAPPPEKTRYIEKARSIAKKLGICGKTCEKVCIARKRRCSLLACRTECRVLD